MALLLYYSEAIRETLKKTRRKTKTANKTAVCVCANWPRRIENEARDVDAALAAGKVLAAASCGQTRGIERGKRNVEV